MKFRVRLRGEQFWLQLDGRPGRFGFFTTRFVEATGAEEAAAKATALVQSDPALRQALPPHKTDVSSVHVDEVVEVASFRGVAVPGGGFTFFPAEDEA